MPIVGDLITANRAKNLSPLLNVKFIYYFVVEIYITGLVCIIVGKFSRVVFCVVTYEQTGAEICQDFSN